MKLALGALLIGLLSLTAARPGTAQVSTGVVERALASKAFNWERSETPNFRLYFGPGVADEIALDEIGERLEAALSHNVRLLGVSYEPPPIRAFFVGSREEMVEVAGGAYGGVALVHDHALAFVSSGGRAPVRHELMHLISVEAWGMPAEPMAWAAEGLGTLAPGTCAGHTIRALGAMMLSTGELPTIEDVVQDFSAASLHAYLGSASLVEYIAVAYGTPAFRVFWSEGIQEGLGQIERSIEELEGGWQQFLSLAEPAPISAWDDIRAEGCE